MSKFRPIHINASQIERFWSKVAIAPGSACWEWQGKPKSSGYGSFMGDCHPAHRVSFLIANGSVDPDLDVDHICRNRRCVRPEHLRQVPHRENTLCGIGPTAVNARKTHCKRGHPFTPDNMRVETTGSRRCLTCAMALKRARRARRHAAGLPWD
ncbi:MAG: HNH endonuclease signature motif containing protein [Thermomicrobiales bacterium]